MGCSTNMRCENTMTADIDVLIISDDVPQKLDKRRKILNKINKTLGYLHPFELHLITKKGFKWYEKFIKDHVMIE